jgi:4-amino-4-deoxy-L-arabinose transferase-like glycosyltransferase
MHFSGSGITSNAYIRSVRELVWKNGRFFLVAGLACLSLRLLFALRFPAVVDDSRLYADIAKNWLLHGIYGVTDSGQIAPTLSRLPGYPAFLAAVFAIFGPDNFRAVLMIQVLFDLGTCFLIADLARRLLSERASKAAFLLAALCPFLANYAAAALTETLEIFFTTVATHLAICALGIGNAAAPGMKFRSSSWLASGLAVGAAILLRPDGGILLAAIGGYLLWLLVRGAPPGFRASTQTRVATLRAGILLGVGAILPLVPWTVRNLRTLHRFEPLAPRYANDSDELVMKGFNRWTKTWIADYVSVQEIYWNVPGETIDAGRLPRRAFDSQQQKDQTQALFDDYNSDHEITPELDSRFAALAAARVQAAPLRHYFWLPVLRIADMWLRPRTELLPSDPRWWEFNDDARWLGVSLGFGIINLLYIALAAAGLARAHGTGIGLFITFLLLRSVFLGTLENPEPRYTLECYPVVILLASAFIIHRAE